MSLCIAVGRYDSMQKLFFDGRNILDRSKMESIGFVYQAIGS
jgi:UDPglucose 6-dehydrogenase